MDQLVMIMLENLNLSFSELLMIWVVFVSWVAVVGAHLVQVYSRLNTFWFCFPTLAHLTLCTWMCYFYSLVSFAVTEKKISCEKNCKSCCWSFI